MSAVSGLSGASQFAPTRGLRTQGSGQEFGPPAEIRQQFEANFASAAKQVGVDSSQFAQVGGKIQDALSKLDLSSSDDPQAAVEQTVNQTLKDNGIDPDKFKADFEKVLGQLGGQDGGFGGAGSSRGISSAKGTSSQELLNDLIKSLNQDDDQDDSKSNSATRIAEFLANAKAGSFVDAQA